MELLEIRSTHDLTAHAPEARRAGAYKYLISCRQFMQVLGNTRKANAGKNAPANPSATLSFMTMSADQIWMTDKEIEEVVSAIRASKSPLSLT
ncbi:MAG: hypothetical protein WCF84_07795 [Anaerolineae bacterium]